MSRHYKQRLYKARNPKFEGMTKEYLEAEYLTKFRPLNEISQEWGVSYRSTWLRAKRMGILVRRERRRLHFIGKKFGSITVLSFDGKNPSGATLWKCKCDCGHEQIYKMERISNSRLQKCRHCIHRDKHGSGHPLWAGHKEISGSIWSKIICGATSRSLPFEISISEAWDLFLKQDRKCALSGVRIIFAHDSKAHTHGGTTASLDRINSKLGYVIGNIQWVHKVVNCMKMDLLDEEFVGWCSLIANNVTGKCNSLNLQGVKP